MSQYTTNFVTQPVGMAQNPRLVKKTSSISIVEKHNVGKSEKEFHAITDHEVAGIGESGSMEKSGDFQSDGQKHGWGKVAKAVHLSAAIHSAAPMVEEEGGKLELSSENFRVGVPYRFKIHSEQLEGKTLVVTCDPPEGASIKIATHKKEGIITFLCTVLPLQEGHFTISTLFGKKNVLGSPFEVTFNPPADATLCTMVEAPSECRTSVDKDTLTFCVHTNQEMEGTLTAVAKSLSSKKPTPVSVNEPGKGHYDVEFDASEGKKYRLAVKFDNQHINGSPFFLHLSDATLCKATGEGITRAIIGTDNRFEVATKGAGPGKLRVKVEGKSQTTVKIESKDEDVYEVTYVLKKVGSYSITVLWMEEEIPGSPFLVSCHKPPSVTFPKPDKSSTYMVGEMYKFKIDVKEAGEGMLEASCGGPEDGAKVEVVSQGRGQYRVEVTPLKTGSLPVSIRWADREVPGSPFHLVADSHPDPSQVTTDGPVYEVGSTKPVVLELNTERGGAGKVKAKCTGEQSKNVAVKVVESQPKRHLISFEPPKQDVYTLWVTWSKQQVPGSPFTINLHPSRAQNCQLVGAPVVPEDWQEPALVTISTARAGNGKLEVRGEGEKSGVLADEHLQVVEKQVGEVEVRLVAPSPDIYSLSLTWCGEEIPISPMRINRVTPNAENCIASMSPPGRRWQDDVCVNVDASEAGNGKLTALAVGQVSGDVSTCISITPAEGKLDHYIIKFSPTTPDIYTFTVEWSGKPVPGFPCRLKRNLFKPNEVKVFKPPAGLMAVGQDISIGVDASQGGPGTLTASCSAKKEEDDVAVNIKGMEEEDEDKYTVYFTPPAEDIYSLSVFWGGEHIEGSPFMINLIPVNASLVRASAPAHPKGLEGPVEVILSTEEAGKAPVTAVCMGGKSGRVPVNVIQNSYSEYTLSFTPPQPDLFTMGVKYGSRNIKSSPFHINTYPANAGLVRVTPPEDMAIGQPVSYSCDATNAGHGRLSATVTGRKSGPVDTDISQSGGAKFSVSFAPQMNDKFTVSIKWEGEDVTDSPFLVNLLPLDPGLITVEGVHIPDESGTEYAHVIIDCSAVGVAPLTTNVTGDTVGDVTTEVEELPDHQHCIKFVPPRDDKYTHSVLFNNGDIPGSPFIMNIVSPQPEKVKLISTEIPNHATPLVMLTFDTVEAGRGTLKGSIEGEKSGKLSDYQVTETLPGTWKVSFIPPSPDSYAVSCLWARREIPQSPFRVDLGPSMASKVVVGEIHIPSDAGTGEEVWLDLDCSAAGHGVMRGEIEDASSFANTQEAKIRNLGLKRYRLKFEPREAGLYNFSVRYGRHHVDGSPFEIDLQLCHPERVKIMEKSLPQYSDGTQGYVLLDTTDAGRGLLTAEFSGQVSGDIPLIFEEKSRKTFKLLFCPPSPDSYCLDIFWSDVATSSSPLRFDVLLPICPEKVVCGEITCLAPKKLAKLDVSTSGAGHAYLSAVCEGEKCGGVEVMVVTSETDRDSHTVTFTPPMEDVYSLSVRYADTVVPGCPFTLDLVPRELVNENFNHNFQKSEVIPLYIPQELKEENKAKEEEEEPAVEGGESYLRQYIGDSLTVNVTAEDKKQRDASLVASAVGDNTGKANIKIIDNPDGSRDVVFKPDKPDCYKIDILLGETALPGSPFVVMFQYYTDPSKCFIYDSDDLTLPIHVDQEVIFGVNATTAGIGKLDVSVEAPDGKQANYLEVTETDIGEYRVSYTPTTAGDHQINLKWGFGCVPGSPVKMKVQDPAVPIYRYGKPITLMLKRVRGSPSELAASAVHVWSKTSYDVTIDRVKKGEFVLAFDATKLGMYRVSIHQSGEEVSGSPYYIRYASPSNASACMVSGFTSPAHIGETTEFILGTSNAGFGEISVRPDIPRSGLDSTVNIRDNRNGQYVIQYTPQAVGEHLIHVMWSEEAVPGSPFSLKVNSLETEANDENVQIAEGDEKLFEEPHAIEKPLKFTVLTHGCRGKLTVNSHGPGKPEILMEKNNDRSFTFRLVSKEPGNFWIDVLWNKRHIPGSPFLLSLLPDKAIQVLGLNPAADPLQASSVHVSENDQCMFKGPQALGQELEFCLETSDAGKGELSVSCAGPGCPEVDVTDNHNGTHTCKLTVSLVGEYKVSVLWNKIHIPGSPFSLTFLPPKAVQMLGLNPCLDPGHASNVSIAEDDKALFTQPQPVKPVEFSILTSGGGKGELCISAKGSSEIIVEMLESKAEGTQTCLLTPSSHGEYCVYVLWDKIHIPGSPFTIHFTSEKARKFFGVSSCPKSQPETQFTKVHVIPEDWEVFKTIQSVNKPVEFRVSTKRAGKGILTLITQGPGKPEVKIGDARNHICVCTIQASIAGRYKVHLLWNNKRVDNNPYELTFQSKEQQVAGVDLENAVLPVGVAHKFKVFYKEVGEGKFDIFCRPSSAAEVVVSPLTNEGYYHCQLIPCIPGNHTLVIQYNDRDILGSPFCVHFDPQMTPYPLIFTTPPIPHNVRVFGPGLTGGSIGQEGNFVIDTSTAGNAKLDFEVLGPRGGFNAQLRQHWENERVLLARFDPTLPGEYRLVMRWSGIEVPGSPFTVLID